MWDLSRYAVEFFQRYLPFPEMQPADELISNPNAHCLAKIGEIYAIYLRDGGSTNLDLGDCAHEFTVHWYNPRSGGALRQGTARTVKGPGKVALGHPGQDGSQDWALLVQRRQQN